MILFAQTPTKGKDQKDFFENLSWQPMSESAYQSGSAYIRINQMIEEACLAIVVKNGDPIFEDEKVIFIEKKSFLKTPSGHLVQLLNQEKESIDFDPNTKLTALPGRFHGYNLECSNLKTDVAFWASLGFKVDQGDGENWLSLSNDSGMKMSLTKEGICPHSFPRISLNYFNGRDNLSLINRIKQLGIPIMEEVSFDEKSNLVENIILQEPGGIGFFLFSDG